ncbi:MAG: hypothetical protein FWC13_08280 [Oscillospiraceae bacterium]|nr:hypothetical protein [Oscillospiraceae bacterium]
MEQIKIISREKTHRRRTLEKIMLLTFAVMLLVAALTSCAAEESDADVADRLMGTWHLYEGNIVGLSDSLTFYADGTGSSVFEGEFGGEFEWSIDADGNLAVLQEGVPDDPDEFPPDYDFTMEIIYIILELTETTFSFETTVYRLGHVTGTYVR